MSFEDNHLNYCGNGSARFQNITPENSAQNSNQEVSRPYINISKSRLEPTAKEFYPSGHTVSNNGAVRRKPQYYKSQGRNSGYTSGRVFTKKYDEGTSNNSQGSSSGHYKNNRKEHSGRYPAERSFHNIEDEEINVTSKHKQNFYNRSEKNYTRKGNYFDKYNRTDKYNRLDKSKPHFDRRNYDNFQRSVETNDSSENSSFSKYNHDSKEMGYNKVKSYEWNKNNKYNDGKQNKDWRATNRERNFKENLSKPSRKLDVASQRERLQEMLNRRLLECLVCCEKIKNTDKVWSCILCYHILHFNCVIAWAQSSKVEKGWRCPACQNVCSEIPKEYRCYCGKIVEPKADPGIIPHGCGEMCLRKGRSCSHKCPILCHPGPCPDCSVMVARPCGCGATQPIVKCSTEVEIVCDSICNKTLTCGIHKCKLICHSGECSPCDEKIYQECYCGKVGRKVSCTAEYKGKTKYSCGEKCELILSCGNHKCEQVCHEGPCETCSRDVSLIHSCPCGKTPSTITRTSCLDPIPCCDEICGKLLKCGQPNAPHSCLQKCHNGLCPPCPKVTIVRCRCGHMDKEIPCPQLTTKADDARCEKKCTKKRLCGKHKCNQRCCIEAEHICPLPCNRQLFCGQHRCSRTCHSGRCPPCMEVSFDELYCECGACVLYPPIPCGTRPPICNKPCSRLRPCGHDVNHACHTGPCPPCTVLSKRWCYGHHEQRSAIPCHQEKFSCGLPCGKEMPCRRHKCIKPCHDGPCPLPCKQPCTIPRTLCGHACSKPCHDAPCPESNCKAIVPVTCLCGLQRSTRPCVEVSEEFKNIQMGQIKDKMAALSKDQTVDLMDINNVKKPAVLKILECTEECRVVERNRRVAIGLQIRNPDLSQKLTPRYTDYMRQWAKKDAHFCQRIHDKLTELVQLAKQSKQKSRSYSFESMNRDKRHFIHEYCEHFGVQSEAYDAEPNRNVVATAIKDKSWLPSMSLLEVIQRENGQRKVPGPVSALGKTTSKSESVCLRLPGRTAHTNPPLGDGSSINLFGPPM